MGIGSQKKVMGVRRLMRLWHGVENTPGPTWRTDWVEQRKQPRGRVSPPPRPSSEPPYALHSFTQWSHTQCPSEGGLPDVGLSSQDTTGMGCPKFPGAWPLLYNPLTSGWRQNLTVLQVGPPPASEGCSASPTKDSGPLSRILHSVF